MANGACDLTELVSAIQALAPEDLPALLTAIAARLAAVRRAPDNEMDDWLTMEQTAKLLNASYSYVNQHKDTDLAYARIQGIGNLVRFSEKKIRRRSGE